MRLASLTWKLGSRPLLRSTPRPSVWLRNFSFKRFRNSGWQQWQNYSPNGRPHIILKSSVPVSLGTVAFAALAQHSGENGDNETTEKRMLEASRRELQKKLDDNDHGLSRVRHGVLLFLDSYVWEPLCTGFRFLHLVVIFVPVLVAVPTIWFGKRHPERDNERTGTLWWYSFLVKAMEMAGPAFIKLGQWAASRSDIFPSEMCDIMSKLHSNAPAHDIAHTRHIISHAFCGKNIEDIFEEFDENPLGVGAIAQVYKAKLRSDLAVKGDADLTKIPPDLRQQVRKTVEPVLKSIPKRIPSSYVAVKILHPRVERLVRRDLRIMEFFARVLNCIPTIEWLSLPGEVEQFGDMMKMQLDLRIEAANLIRFRKNFKDRTTAWFPFPYSLLTSRNVLVEEYAQGIPLADFIENGGGVFQGDIADEGLDAFLRMVLMDNFVHADLHPGNILVRFYQAEKPDLSALGEYSLRRQHHTEKQGGGNRNGNGNGNGKPHPRDQEDVTEKVLARLRPLRKRRDKEAWKSELAQIDREGYRPQLIFIDTGLVTELNEVNRRNFLDLFRAVAEFDGYRAGHLMCERCRQPEAVLDQEVFALKMEHLVLGVKNKTLALGNIKIGDILQQVLGMVRNHHVRLEGDFVNIVISILLLEGIGRTLNPNVDLLSSSLPILRELGTQGGAEMIRKGDFSMMLVWMGLETRKYLQASIEDVERCVKYDLLSPNV